MKSIRNISFLLLFSTLILPVFAQKGYRIEVKVNGFSGPEPMLAYYYGDKQYLRDTAVRENGVFVFKGEEALPGGIYLVVLPPKNNYFELMLDKDQDFSLETDTLDFIKGMKIKGSEENRLFYADLAFIGEKRKTVNTLNEQIKTVAKGSEQEKQIKDQVAAIDKEVTDYRKQFMAEHPELFYSKVLHMMEPPQIPEAPKDANGKALDSLFAFKYYRAHLFDNIDFADDRLLRTPIMYGKVNEYIERLTPRHPDSLNRAIDYIVGKSRPNDDVYQFYVMSLLNKFADPKGMGKYMGMDGVYVHMVEEYYMHEDRTWWVDSATRAKMIERALALSPNLIGRPAYDFYATDLAGRSQHVNGVTAKYTILYMWDYDCGHCKTVTPKLVKAFKTYAGKDVKLMALSINGDVEVWKQKVKEYGLDMPNAINIQDHARRSGFDQKYDIRSTPRIFLLDANKKIMAKQISVHQLQEILNRELGMPAPEPEEGAEEEIPED